MFALALLQVTDLVIMSSEDELVSLDDLQEKIGEFDDYIQSTDVAAMQSASYVYPFLLLLTGVSRTLEGSIWRIVVCLVRKGVEQMIAVVIV